MSELAQAALLHFTGELVAGPIARGEQPEHSHGGRGQTRPLDGARMYHDRGAGPTVVLLQPGFVADGMLPLLDNSALASYRLIAPHRRGYGQSDRIESDGWCCWSHRLGSPFQNPHWQR
jgi:pimeloyl-ACP methyl ester carboxylesterase